MAIPPLAARFYYSAPSPCPYLQGKVERRIFADLSGPQAAIGYDLLSEAGFRRSLGFAYRPACPGCNACVPVRIPAHGFEDRRAWRRVRARNADLTLAIRPARATLAQYALFARYQKARHADGDMARMDFGDYRTMVEVGTIDSRILEMRAADGTLICVCLCDYLGRGISAVYNFFDPDQPGRGLGTFAILWLIDEAQRTGLDHVYLGFWIAESDKMAYKARFRPLEGLTAEGWQLLPDERA